MRQAIRTAEGYFNADRMVIEYYNRLYKPIAHEDKETVISPECTRMPASQNDAWAYSNIK